MKKPLLVLIAVICLLISTASCGPDNRVHVIFLDVGQGDAILIRQGNTEILIDGGPSPGAAAAQLSRFLPFWDRTLELVVLTHQHPDHLAGLVEVLRRYTAKTVLQPPLSSMGDGYESGLVTEWQALVAEKHIPVIPARACQEITLGSVRLDVLNPPVELLTGTASNADNNAIVLAVRIGTRTFLLTSDIEQEAELNMIYSRLVPDCDVLKVAHHGSSNATSQAFLDLARPEAAVICVGENTYGHPTPETLGRLGGLPVYRTDKNGAVEFVTDGTRLWLKTDR